MHFSDSKDTSGEHIIKGEDMSNYQSYKYNLEEMELLIDQCNEIIRNNLKTYFLGVKKFVKNIDNGRGVPARDMYVGVELDKEPSSRAPIHEIFSRIERLVKKEHRARVCYYIRGYDK